MTTSLSADHGHIKVCRIPDLYGSHLLEYAKSLVQPYEDLGLFYRGGQMKN